MIICNVNVHAHESLSPCVQTIALFKRNTYSQVPQFREAENGRIAMKHRLVLTAARSWWPQKLRGMVIVEPLFEPVAPSPIYPERASINHVYQPVVN